MPYAIDLEAAKKQINLNVTRQQEVVQREPDGSLREGWLGTVNGGLPVRQIPHYSFPVVLYLWPNVPTRTVVHRNSAHEIVFEEEIPLEHKTKTIACPAHANGGFSDCAECNKLLDAALTDGWRREPYIGRPAPREDADLYGPVKKNPLEEKKEKK